MGRNTSISLGNHFENFISESITDGRYGNVSEVIRAGLRLLENEENKIKNLRNAIKEGLESGIANDFNPRQHLELLKSQKKLNG